MTPQPESAHEAWFDRTLGPACGTGGLPACLPLECLYRPKTCPGCGACANSKATAEEACCCTDKEESVDA